MLGRVLKLPFLSAVSFLKPSTTDNPSYLYPHRILWCLNMSGTCATAARPLAPCWPKTLIRHRMRSLVNSIPEILPVSRSIQASSESIPQPKILSEPRNAAIGALPSPAICF